MAKAKANIEVIDRNGNRRAYCESKDQAGRECKRQDKQRPDMAPHTIKGEAD